MDRASVRRGIGVAVVFVGALIAALTISACTPAAGESPSAPTQAPLASPSESPASVEPAPSTTWTPPADPTAEGPTAAPELPTEEASLDEPLAFSTGITVALDSITTTEITPQTPGEYAGPAVVVTVSVRNESDDAQPVSSAVVMLEADDGEVGIATTAGPNRPLQGDVPVGGTARGSYVFMLDPAKNRDVTITVNYAAGEPIAKFTGSTP